MMPSPTESATYESSSHTNDEFGPFDDEQSANTEQTSVLDYDNRFQFMSAAELADAEFHTEYLIDGVLVKGQPCILAGPKKTLKTSMLIDLGLSLATGTEFLGRFQVPHSVRVGLMSGESGAATIKETSIRVAASKGVDLRDVNGMHFCDALPTLGNACDESLVRRVIESYGLEVMIFDPVYLCMKLGDNASSLFHVGAALGGISEIGR